MGLFGNRSFRHYLSTQALGAFNDNVFKQIVLLLCVGQASQGRDLQSVVQAAFAIPFVVFSGLAGDIADRFSKGRIMVLCKVAEVVVMIVGVLVLLAGVDETVLWLLAFVTFLMGTQSAFFGPPKYGGLPELIRDEELAPAAGLVQMTTFIAIILGVAVAGWLLDALGTSIWLAALATVAIALLGVWTSLGIARVPSSDPSQRIGARSFVSMFPTLRQIIREDRLLLRIVVIYSWFWLVGGVSLVAINAFGRLQLGLSNFWTSVLVSTLSVGIALGSVIVGRLSKGSLRLGLVVPGIAGTALSLAAIALLPVHVPTPQELESFRQATASTAAIIPAASDGVLVLAFAILLSLGVSAGFFSVPLLAFVQSRPAPGDRGKVFAAANWCNWIFIMLSAVTYGLLFSLTGGRAHLVLAVLGGMTAVVGSLLIPGLLREHRSDPT